MSLAEDEQLLIIYKGPNRYETGNSRVIVI